MIEIQASSATDDNDDYSAQQESHELSLAIMKADMQAAMQQKQSQNDELSQSNPTEALKPALDEEGNPILDAEQLSRVIEMAWEDRTTFEAIEHSYGLDETAVIKLMRQELKPSSFKLWRERVTGRNTKHDAKRDFEVGRAYCKTQYKPR